MQPWVEAGFPGQGSKEMVYFPDITIPPSVPIGGRAIGLVQYRFAKRHPIIGRLAMHMVLGQLARWSSRHVLPGSASILDGVPRQGLVGGSIANRIL
jgi:hypothetical protein